MKASVSKGQSILREICQNKRRQSQGKEGGVVMSGSGYHTLKRLQSSVMVGGGFKLGEESKTPKK